MNLEEFLGTVITVQEGYFCLAHRNNGEWHEEFYDWPSQSANIVERSNALKDENDVYYTSYLFSEKNSKKASAILDGHYTIQADLDNADPKLLQFEPSLLVQTSKNRYQCYWKLSEQHYDIESLSRKLTYSIFGCDRSGWPIGHKMRLPGTYNYKYISIVETYSTEGLPSTTTDGRQPVFIVPTHVKLYEPAELDILPEVLKETAKTDVHFISSEIPTLTIGPNELLETVKKDIPIKVYSQYNILAKDRSTALWALMCSLFRAGMSRAEVLYLAHHSINNKWLHLPRELQKDVLRAEVVSNDIGHDAKEIVINARRMSGTIAEKHRYVLGAVQTLMGDMGQFVKTHKGGMYVHSSTGKPIELGQGHESLQTYLGSVFGLNPVEKEHQFVTAGLAVYSNSLTMTTESSALSYYDMKSNTMLLHTGRKDVIRITPSHTETITNGNGVVFDWIMDADPFAPVQEGHYDWATDLFTLHNTSDLSVEEFIAVMRSWLLFLLFRNMSSARPVLALLGQPGSGKTTTAKRIYSLIYGQRKKISALSNYDDFDNAVSNQPFVFYDNVDTFLSWLPDRIAQSAGAIDVGKRALYTNNDSYIIKRDAMIAVTSHNPRFLRSDVVDRLIIVNLNRYDENVFASESNLIHYVVKNRNLIWGSIVRDIQTILGTVRPLEATVPMRISDFTTMGEWFATALNYQPQFISAMKVLRKAQKFTDLEEDQVLATALLEYVKHSKHTQEYRMPGALWMELTTSYTSDPASFQKIYKNASQLSKKMSTLQQSLKDILEIDWLPGPIKTWRVRGIDGGT